MPSASGPMEAPSTATGSVRCPWCWAVWGWSFPTDANYAADGLGGDCPRCGRTIVTLPASVQSMTRLADQSGFPSE